MAADTIGRYQIIAELGRGGMATVYHAHDPEFERDVAIKVLPREFLHDLNFRARFKREVRTIAALEHPAIVPVHDSGEHEGQPFLVMRYMAGGTLAERVQQETIPLAETARIVEQIAPALDYAHGRGFIHRDLKPGNLLFDQHGHAFIADFGIARLIHSTSQVTGSGAIVGTPAYMSPEQIQSKDTLDGRSDLYSLGVVIFEMLAGRHPFVVNDPVGYFSAHLNDPAPDIRSLNPGLPEPLTDILHMALAKNREYRYQTAADLARDLRAMAGEQTQAAPILAATRPRTAEWDTISTPTPLARRRVSLAWLVGGIGLVGVVIGGLALGGVFAGGRPVETQPVVIQITATPDLAQAVEVTVTPTDSPAATATPALEAVMSANLRKTWIAFASDMVGSPGTIRTSVIPERFNEIYLIHPDGSELTRLTVNEAADRQPSWSPDGRQIAFASDRDGGDWEIYVMDASGLNQTRLTDSPGADTDPSWSPDGTQIAFVSERDGNREIMVMDADGSNPVRLTDHSSRDQAPDWSPDGTRIAFNSSRAGNDDVYVMNTDGSDLIRVTAETVTDELPVWSPDGSLIAFRSEIIVVGYPTISIFDLTQNLTVWSMSLGGRALRDASWSPDGRWLVVGLFERWTKIVLVRLPEDLTAPPLQYELLGGVADHKDYDWLWTP